LGRRPTTGRGILFELLIEVYHDLYDMVLARLPDMGTIVNF